VKESEGFLKSPSTALHSNLSHSSVQTGTPHSFGFVRLVPEVFYEAF